MLQIRFAGKGGQGIVLAGTILARACALYQSKNAIQTQSYGPEARGSACSSCVIISSTHINELRVTKPEVMVIMSQEALDKYKKELKFCSSLLVDSSTIFSIPKTKNINVNINIYKIPATKLASELNAEFAANLVMLGALARIGIVSKSALEKSIADIIPEKYLDLNLLALRKGYEYGEDI